jgi:hypothetical protein
MFFHDPPAMTVILERLGSFHSASSVNTSRQAALLRS